MDMKTNDDQFDDFKVPEAAIYVNEAIGRVFEKEQTEVELFKEESIDDIISMGDNPQDKLTELIIEYIQGAGDVNQVNICSYRAKRGMGIDAWGFNGDDESTTIDLFLTLYFDPSEKIEKLTDKLNSHFNWLINFFNQSKEGKIFSKISDNKSDLYQVALLINKTPTIDRIRLFLMTNAIIPFYYDKPNEELESGTSCEFYVWDAKRVMQQDHIMSGKNPIVVNFEGDYNCTLPCIKMPDVSENVTCYLCIIPGIVLSQVYHKYHQQILEMNVRTFLQFKGASNRGIRNTLIGHKATPAERRKGVEDSEAEPDMFFAYNNGISATASEVRLNEEGNAITCIKSWQIVNGGQTTAAIHAVMGMKDVDITELTNVYVAMKISVIKNKDNIPYIVPRISRFANTQSAVKKSDFNINEQFLVELEQRSREEWVLNSLGKPVSKWFFERARGQYLEKAKRQGNARAEKEFYAEYPKNQMFDKAMLSKFMMAWDQNPASICKGGENNYGVFFTRMKQQAIHFDSTRYHRTIAKAILFKAIDTYYGKDGLSLPGYKSNMVAYTVSLLSHLSAKSLDLDTLWKEQCVISPSVYNELTIDIYNVYAKILNGAEHVTYKVKETYVTTDGKRKNRYVPKSIPTEDLEKIKQTMLYRVLQHVKKIEPIVYSHIIEVNEGENINEWTKKPQCWDSLKIKASNLGTSINIPQSLCSAAGDMDIEVTEGQLKYINEATEIDAETWFSINAWSKENPGELTPKEQAFIGQVAWNVRRNRPLTYKQSKWALDIYDKAKEAGWEE